MRVVRGIGALVAGLVLLAEPAHAGDTTQIVGEQQVQVRVWSPWPRSVFKGWAPLRIELESEADQERVVRLTAESRMWHDRSVDRSFRLAPGERVELELLLPLDGANQCSFGLSVRCAEDQAYFGDCVGSNMSDNSVRQILLVSETVPAAGKTEAWSSTLSVRESGTVTSAPSPLPGGIALPPGAAITYTAGGAVTTPDVDLAHATFAGLARQWAAYTSLDLVVLDLSSGSPRAAELAPLAAWVRSGGDLLVIGERAREQAAAFEELAAWMEPRFLQARAWGSEYRCGLGRLCIGDADADVLAYDEWINALLSDAGGTSFDSVHWRGTLAIPTIPGLDLLPVRTFALILLCFALLIGPVNFLFIAKKKKAVLLLVTIPAIAAGTTLLLLAYAIFFQGLEVKTASIASVLLDERAHRSSAVETRQLFAGMTPAEGLAPEPGTTVNSTPGNGFERLTFEVEHGQTTLLKGDYLPSRVPVVQVLATERAERARLVMQLDGNRLQVDNNLGADLTELAVRVPDGRVFTLGTSLAAGASVELRPTLETDGGQGRIEALHQRALPLSAARPESDELFLPAGCYLAGLATNPFRDACGIELNELAGTHVLFGVLPLDEEAWR